MKKKLLLIITLICLSACTKEEINPLLGGWGEMKDANKAYKIVFTDSECTLYEFDKHEEDSTMLIQSNYIYTDSYITLTEGYTWKYEIDHFELTINKINNRIVTFLRDYTPEKFPSVGGGNSGNVRCGYDNGHLLYKGPKGGCFYYNSKGGKTYVDKSKCKC